ncbi:hypothetical protein ACOBR2_15385 [Telmatobacter bradus]|uniref:hypothetical protein n=1 Tax=Telmatobacter bradus TaxID=474953 RepID=UPI003B436D47
MKEATIVKHLRSPEWTWPVLAAYTLLQMWAAHACVFFAHEYAHAFTAWLLGWKSNPFALHYPRPTLVVFLIQLGINQNVDEGPIFASGHGPQAAIIGAAGALVGNALITYTLSRWGYAKVKQVGSRGWAMFAYWTTVASLGNFLDYVPLRTFTLEGDMGSIQRGFGWPPWMILVVLGIPTLLALIYFFARIERATLAWLFPQSAAKRSIIAILTAFTIFGFYGAAGLLEGGPVSYRLSVISVGVCFPFMAFLGAKLVHHRAGRSSV